MFSRKQFCYFAQIFVTYHFSSQQFIKPALSVNRVFDICHFACPPLLQWSCCPVKSLVIPSSLSLPPGYVVTAPQRDVSDIFLHCLKKIKILKRRMVKEQNCNLSMAQPGRAESKHLSILVVIGQHLPLVENVCVCLPVHVRVLSMCMHRSVCPALTDESFASIFEQSALVSFSVEAMLF